MRSRSLGAAVVVLFLACGRPADPVRSTLDRMVKAANERNAAGVLENVAADFQAADGSTRADDEALLHRLFAAYAVLDVRLEDVRIERSENGARVRMRAVMSGQPQRIGGLSGLLPSSSSYDFDLRLAREGNAWKVAWASWTPVS
jgi:hypothetical protein